MQEMLIEVETREAQGKNANRRLRAEGKVPAVVYGANRDTVPIVIDRKTLRDLLRGEAGEHSVFLLRRKESGQERHAMIRDMQVHPITREILHVDFLRVLMDEKIRLSVSVNLVGTPKGVKDDGGVLDFVTREVEIECLPGNIPSEIDLDVSALLIGDHLEASALQMPDKVELLEDPSRTIVSVNYPDRVEDEDEDEDEGLLERATAEPEVIGKGATEEGDDGEE